MEEIKSEGLAKSIGVSNFREEDLMELQKTWKIVPSVNQVGSSYLEINPVAIDSHRRLNSTLTTTMPTTWFVSKISVTLTRSPSNATALSLLSPRFLVDPLTL